MSAFKLQTLKQKLWAIVAASFIARVIMFFVLPSTPSSLAPDEGTYAFLAKWISESKPATDFPGFGEGLYLSGRSLIIPASTFIKLGMNELDAVRLTSSIYGFLSLCVVAYLCSRILKSADLKINNRAKIEHLVVTLLAVYAFLPSHFVWSNLGLREGPNEFWLILTFVGVFLLYKEEQSKKFLFTALILISIVCTFSSRPQVGWVLVVTLLIYSSFKLKNKLTYLLITSALTGLFAGYLATTSFAYVTSDTYVAKDAAPTPTKDAAPTPTKDAAPTPTKDAAPTPTKDAAPTPTKDATPTPTNRAEFDASKLCNGSKTKVEYEGKLYNCIASGTITKRERPMGLTEVAIGQVQALPQEQFANQIGAASIIERLACPWEESSGIGKYGCLAFRAPYMTFTFLFRPLPFIDTTSLTSTFAAAENVLWIFIFTLIVYRVSKFKRIPFVGDLTPALIFFSLYVLGAGSSEGNMGTAFRHKSLILWVVLLLLFAVFWRGQDESRRSRGNNSQESAV
jgi:hypothetical protein